ncbi:helix-hairpin-helix domain-containing protein [Candidatus Nitrospira bockiana]
MKRVLGIGGIGLMIAALATTGCVGKDKYLAAVAEKEATAADLEKIRTQKSALEQQVKSLKDANAKLTADTEFVAAELQRIKESREKERSSIDTRTKELEQKVKDLTAQHRILKQEYEDVKKHNETLKATVARYQKELKERERAIALPTPPSSPKAPSTPPPAASDAAPAGPSASMPQPPASPALSAVNVNTASASDMVLFLGLTKDMADRVVANRPYKVKGELVAKNVMPKSTFDLLKDRITVAQ